MTDPVALTSVVSTGLVALVGLAVAYQMTREQRRHDFVRARSERSWEVEADGMADLIATCRSLVDALDRPGSFDAIAELDLERGDYEATVREHLGVSEIGVRVGDVVRDQDLLVRPQVRRPHEVGVDGDGAYAYFDTVDALGAEAWLVKPLDAGTLRRTAKRFVDEHVQPGDLAAVVHTQGTFTDSQVFTSSKALLDASIEGRPL